MSKVLKKHFKGDEIKALDGVDQQIRKGEVVVVIGPSGSGKSTFLRCLNLLEIPTAGTICFEGTDITDARMQYQHCTARRWGWCSSSSTSSLI